MERRLRRLEVASQSALLRRLATAAAEEADLDPELVLREAEALMAQWAGLSLPEIAAREGLDPAEMEAGASDLLARLRDTTTA